LLVACTSEDESASVSIPDGAVPVGTEAVSTEALAAVADLRPGDELYRLPVGDDRGVLIRVRGEEPPLLFGTSCDVVSAAPLPVGWQGTCLEYTWQARRIHGRFPHGTTSVKAPATVTGFTSPQEAALAVAQLTYPVADIGAVDSMVVIYADSKMIDLRVRVDDGHFCQWYGVSGVLEGGRLVYQAGPALPCESDAHATG
jgi:hypothetical protein